MVDLALEGFSNSEYCEYDRTGWVEYSKILYKPSPFLGSMFSLRGNLLRTMLRIPHRALPLQRSMTCGSRISPSSFPLFSVFAFFHSVNQLGNRGTGGYIVCWLSRISTPVCRERMLESPNYKFVREQTMMPTLHRRIRMLRNNPTSAFKTIEKHSRARGLHRLPSCFSRAVRIVSSRKKWQRGSERN